MSWGYAGEQGQISRYSNNKQRDTKKQIDII